MKKQLYSVSTIIVVFLSINAVVPYLTQGHLDIGDLDDYEDPFVPTYIFNEKTHTDTLSNEIATLGRVLFYDNHLSLNESISCASCHKQEFAFGDTLVASPGFDKKLTERHSTRLVNLNFSHMPEVFWDRRAGHLDSLPLMVLSNSIEMGFSGKDGQPDIDSLVNRLDQVEYLEPLFDMAYGSSDITAEKVNLALTQFVRSIVSYDSKYDIARSMVDSARQDFPLFTAEENLGKSIYFSPFSPQIVNRGSTAHMRKMGCAECHGIDNFTSRKTSLTGNNGIIGVIGHENEIDTTVKRSPSLRDLINPEGIEIGPFMHDGSLPTLSKVMDHYSTIGLQGHKTTIGLHTSLDVDQPNGTYNGAGGPSGPQGPVGPPPAMIPRLNADDTKAVIAFMKTLTGQNIYTDPKWSDPFNDSGQLTITDHCDDQVIGEEHIEICEGEQYQQYYRTGIYKKRIKRIGQCDSIVHINLNVIPAAEEVISTTICYGEEYEGYNETGQYLEVLSSAHGCDSLRWINLEVLPRKSWHRNIRICRGMDYEGYTERGYYIDTLVANNGCDSIRTINLRITNPSYDYTPIEICEGEAYDGYSQAGYYYYYKSVPGECDLGIYLNLTVIPTSEEYIQTETCEDDPYEGYTGTGIHVDTLVNYMGCDSIRTIDLTVLYNTDSEHNTKICQGEAYEGYTESGLYTDILTNQAGCDSTRYIELTVLSHSQSYTAMEICEGEEYEGYTHSGHYIDMMTNAAGCDSTRVIDLKILKHSESYYSPSICLGETYEGYNSTGSYVDVLSNHEGCDSTRHIELTVLYPSESYEEPHICPGENYEGYTEGEHYELHTNAVGCDSLRIINVIEILEEDVICTPEYEEEYKLIDDTDYISIYPNPIADIMNIKIDKPERTTSTLRIYDSNHAMVLTQNIDDRETAIDASDLPAGVYIVHIRDGLNRFVGKVFKL